MIKGFYTLYFEPVNSTKYTYGWHIIFSENEHELKMTHILKNDLRFFIYSSDIEELSENLYKCSINNKDDLIILLFALEQYKIKFSKQLTKKFNFRNSDFSGCENIVELQRRIVYFYDLLKCGVNVNKKDVDKVLDKINNNGFEKISAFDIVLLNNY